jgi:DNA polymerase III alpha subunit (gram-positive type)
LGVKESFYAFLDTETTGVNPGTDEAIEIATVLTDLKYNEVARFDQKIQFTHSKMTPKAAELNGYDPKVWAYEAVPFYHYQAFLTKHIPYGHVAIPIGHNVDFDRNILDQFYFKPYGKFFPLSYHKIDTMGISLLLRAAGVINVPDVKLATVCAALKIPHVDAHRAMGDLVASRKIYEFAIGVLQS